MPLQIKNFFSRYKKATGAANTSNIPVAAIDSVEMDGDEEDAMMEAIQGSSSLDLTNRNFNSPCSNAFLIILYSEDTLKHLHNKK